MKLGIAAIALIIAACVAAPASMEVRQASELAGRTAGPARRCVPIERNEGLRVANGDTHTILYGRGGTVWANRLGPDCGFAQNASLIVQPVSASYCRGDLVRSIDPTSGIRGPSCFLGDFVPYTR